MSWTSDPELQAMFMSELDDRSARLAEGGRAMVADAVDEEMASTMLREGHTIKGTGRVMGFEAVSRAGQQLEQLWRRIQHGELEMGAPLGEAIVAVATALPAAGSADPETGTPELSAALGQLGDALGSVDTHSQPKLRAVSDPGESPRDVPDEASAGPESAEAHETAPQDGAHSAGPVEPEFQERRLSDRIAAAAAATERGDEPSQQSKVEPSRPVVSAAPVAVQAGADSTEEEPVPFVHEHVRPRRPKQVVEPVADVARPMPIAEAAASGADLGGLLGAVESWASVETLPVSAGRMYRLINLVARIRIDLEATEAKLKQVRNSDDLDALEAGFVPLLAAATELEHDAMQLAAVPLSSMTNTLPQLVRFVAKKLDKEVRFEIVGDTDVIIDRQVLDKIADPLRQLVVNSITHGIESPAARSAAGKPPTGSISLTATVKDHRVELVVTDDGAGVDWNEVRDAAVERDLLSPAVANDQAKLNDVLFTPGFSTVGSSELGGEGKGLAAVADTVESLFGRVRLESAPARGTTVSMIVPMSRALQRVLVFESAGMQWGIPEAVVEEVVPIEEASIDWEGDDPTMAWRGETIPVAALGELVGTSESRLPKRVLIISHRVGSAAVTVESVAGVREVAAKELGPLLAGPSHVTGAALLGGGEVVLVVDAAALVQRSHGSPVDEKPGDRVLVVDDSLGARAVVSGALASSGFKTSVASSAAEALEVMANNEFDALVVDFSMPHEDGAQLVAKLRDSGVAVPVVMLSGVANEEDRQRAEDAGVDVFFDKADFREGALAETLRRMLAENER